MAICLAEAQAGDDYWKQLHSLVDMIGVDGHSSDETDGKEYIVTVRDWCNPKVTELLQEIDDNRSMTTAYGQPRPGGQPRKRIRPRRPHISEKRAITNLPVNVYDPAWLDTLTEAKYAQLAPGSPITVLQSF